ncbi:MAG: peptidoglycan DD-metalloendopeptidase family protein, partial [Thermomicrobiales bacterium]|nr:peptidoglycan DD-metalloendopeptidase family protein [Thermomicrobiales bacterium]
MRHLPGGSTAKWIPRAARAAGVLALAAWLTIFPLAADQHAGAAPPSGSATSPASLADSAPPSEKRGDERPARTGDESIQNANAGSASSVRPRGLEAPVQLRPEARPADVETRDGPVPPARDSRRPTGNNKTPDSRQAERASTPNRVWPLPRGEYIFTQRFGCVAQIAAFYQAGSGCPADAPVVHTGIDLAAPEGTPFYAAASGWVTEAGPDRQVGVANTRIIIQHDGRNEGMATEYLHWIATFVKPGDYVRAGEPIGEVGSVGYSTGPHLHFGLIDLDSGEHLDPIRWLPKQPGSEGYRGITPAMKAHLRLPAGTTAGLPETADPSPPPPPARQDVPDRPPRGKDEKAARKKAKRKRDTRQADRHGNAAAEGSAPARADRSTARGNAPASEESVDGSEKQGRNRERTRKRERNKDGTASESRDSGASETTDKPKVGKRDNNRRNHRGGDNASKRDDKPNRKNDRGNQDKGSQKPSGGKKNKDKPADETGNTTDPGNVTDPGTDDTGADPGDGSGAADPSEIGSDTATGASEGEESASAAQTAGRADSDKGKRGKKNGGDSEAT